MRKGCARRAAETSAISSLEVDHHRKRGGCSVGAPEGSRREHFRHQTGWANAGRRDAPQRLLWERLTRNGKSVGLIPGLAANRLSRQEPNERRRARPAVRCACGRQPAPCRPRRILWTWVITARARPLNKCTRADLPRKTSAARRSVHTTAGLRAAPTRRRGASASSASRF